MKTYTNFLLLTNTDGTLKHNRVTYTTKVNRRLEKSNVFKKLLGIRNITLKSIIYTTNSILGLPLGFVNDKTTFLSKAISIAFCNNIYDKISEESIEVIYDTVLLNTNNFSLEGFF